MESFFEDKIRPVLVKHCYECHSLEANKSSGGLLLDSREAARRGGDTGPAVVPGDLTQSVLVKAIRYDHADLQMPPKSKLAMDLIANFEQWIVAGAVDPRDSPPGATTTIDIDEGRKHWSFQSLSNPPVPQVGDESWPHTEIDRFILAALESKGLKPVADAQRHELRRRIYYDLIGLPPDLQQRGFDRLCNMFGKKIITGF